MAGGSPVFITLGGFLGAGKTTLMTAAADLLREQSLDVVLVTNDQGDQLVDTATALRTGAPVREVTGGCFCCRFDDLVEVVVELVDRYSPDVVIAEAVGSCTDLTATVIRPLRRFYGDRLTVAPLAVVLDPARLLELGAAELSPQAVELGWLLHTQLEDGDLIVLSKSDQVQAAELAAVQAALSVDYPMTPLVTVSSVTGEGLAELVRGWLSCRSPGERFLGIDYQRYGSAEALLAWGDRRVRIDSVGGGDFSPDEWVGELLREIAHEFGRRSAVIGHVKVGVQAAGGAAKVSLVGQGTTVVDHAYEGRTNSAEVLINARVGIAPEALGDVLDEAVRHTCASLNVSETTLSRTEFAPSQPKPTHRLTATAAAQAP